MVLRGKTSVGNEARLVHGGALAVTGGELHKKKMLASERDPRLDRLFALTDGVYAIALTLLAIELALPEASEHLHGEALLQSILDSWPKVLSFLTSLTLITIF